MVHRDAVHDPGQYARVVGVGGRPQGLQRHPGVHHRGRTAAAYPQPGGPRQPAQVRQVGAERVVAVQRGRRLQFHAGGHQRVVEPVHRTALAVVIAAVHLVEFLAVPAQVRAVLQDVVGYQQERPPVHGRPDRRTRHRDHLGRLEHPPPVPLQCGLCDGHHTERVDDPPYARVARAAVEPHDVLPSKWLAGRNDPTCRTPRWVRRRARVR